MPSAHTGRPAAPARIDRLRALAGVALLVLTPRAALDATGVAAGLGAAAAMAAGTVLSKLWRPPVSPLVFTGWQLTAGGLMLAPLALALEGPPPALSAANVAGLAWLGLIGAAATYALWFRGLARLPPSVVSPLALLSQYLPDVVNQLTPDGRLPNENELSKWI